MKPPISYFGGKTTTGPAIAELLPPHRHYVEPYGGSLAVLLAKRPSAMETVNDLDHRLMTFWRILRARPAELERACALTPHARAEHAGSYELDGVDDLEVARRVWVQLTQGRAGTRRRTGWRHYVKPAGQTSMPKYLTGYVARVAPAVQRLHDVSLECLPALDLIAKYGAEPDVLLYCDPPYLGSTRSKSWDGYTHEMRGGSRIRSLRRRCTPPGRRSCSPATPPTCTTASCTRTGTGTPWPPAPGRVRTAGRTASRCCGRTVPSAPSGRCSTTRMVPRDQSRDRPRVVR